MAGFFNFASESQRVGRIRGHMLPHAMHQEVLGITGRNETFPRNQGDTIIFRRWLPFGASEGANNQNRPKVDVADHLIQEGVTPNVDSIKPVDVDVTIHEYGCVYGYTDKTAALYEDDVPMAEKQQCGERIGLLREMLKYGALKGCSNRMYAGGVTSRATVAGLVTKGLLRKASRVLLSNHTGQIRQILAPSINIDTTAVEAAWLVFGHTDLESDWRDLPGFTHVKDYGSRKVVHENEVGSVERFRFVDSPELHPYENAGANKVSGANARIAGAAKNHVYPMILVGQNAWADLALRGRESMKIVDLPAERPDKADILGQRGYVGAKFWAAPYIQNDGWMMILEVAATAEPA